MKLLRWLLFIPGAIFFAQLAGFVSIHMTNIFDFILPRSEMIIVHLAVGSAFSGWVYVLALACICPSESLIPVKVMVAFGLCYCILGTVVGVVLIRSNILMFDDFQARTIGFCTGAGMLASWIRLNRSP